MLAVLEPDEAPPGAFDEDRHGHDRERAEQLQHLPLVGRQVADVAADRLARGEDLGPAGEVRCRPEVPEPRIVHHRHLARGPAGAPDRERRPVLAGDVLEHVGAAGGGRLAEHAHQVDHRLVEDGLLQEVLGGAADGLEDRLTAAQVALGANALLASLGVREHDRELAGDVDEERNLVLVPVREAGGC